MPAVEIPALRMPLWGGHTVLREVFGEEELAAARRGQEAFYRGEVDLKPEFAWRKPRRTLARSRKHPYASFYRSELAAIARSAVLGERIAEVTGAKVVRFWHDQLLSEAPRRSRRVVDCHWHTERSRWKTCRCPLMVTAWIPLERVGAEMGPITMVEGSEKQPWIDVPEGWLPEVQAEQRVVIEPGDVSLHCWHTVHGNPPNWGKGPRRVMAVHFALGVLEYQRCGQFAHVNERVVGRLDGVPDFEDERVCPVVWRVEA